MQALRTIALRYPEAEEGIACKGTALECSAFKVRQKAFLFVGAAEMKVKLHDSLAEASKLASDEPDRCTVGVHGWVTVKISANRTSPAGLLEKWIDESFRLLAPRQLVATLPAMNPPPSAKLAPVRKRAKPAPKRRRSTRG